MSVTTPAASHVEAPTNPRNRARRLRLFAPVFVFVAVLGYSSLSQPWYQATMRSATVLNVSGVSANVTLTGNQLTALGQAAPSNALSAPQNPRASSHFGVLDPVFWLIVAMALGVLGALGGGILPGIFGLGACYFSWQALLSIRSQVEQPRTWGSFTVVRSAGQQHLWFALTLGMLLLLASSFQALAARKSHRPAPAPATTTATAAGELTIAGVLSAMLHRNLRLNPTSPTTPHEHVS